MRLTPDGQRYLAMADGIDQPAPFHLRWLLPLLLSKHAGAWTAVSFASIAVVALGCAWLALTLGATELQAAAAALLFVGLPSVRFAASAPVLVDMPGLALATMAALLWAVEPIAAMACAVVGAAVWEKAPVWAAVFAWEPLLLAALLVPLLRVALSRPVPVNSRDPLAWTFRPFEASRRGHTGRWRDPRLWLAPWGLGLLVLLEPTWPLGIALALGYAQLLVATDSVRLYQQAAPVVCASAALVIPEPWLLPAVVAHWFNPWMGEGV